ncbi:glutamate receptor ionotropic, NMDA 3A isoform X2 [Octopus bimaculoides]|nr:glutamate receptor ionotropic, NMDA 3A isoform X2 [Octopus bimaculoides]
MRPLLSQIAVFVSLVMPLVWIIILPGVNTQHNRTIAALFDKAQYSLLSRIFTKAITELRNNSTQTRFQGYKVKASTNFYDVINEICRAIKHGNVESFIVVGKSPTIHAVNIVAEALSIPVLGYMLGEDTLKIGNMMYLNLKPNNAQLAKGIIAFLENYDTVHTFSLISQEELIGDGFTSEITKLIQAHKWILEESIKISESDTDEIINVKIRQLRDNKARINILHCSNNLITRIFKQVYSIGLKDRDYAWLLTEHDYIRSTERYHSFPIGSLSFSLSVTINQEHIVSDVVNLISQAMSHIKHLPFGSKRECSKIANSKQIARGKALYKSILKASGASPFLGPLFFDSDGHIQISNFIIKNLIHDGEKVTWREIGYIRNGDVRIREPIWPIDHILPTSVNGRTRYRIVTNPVKPFVMEEAPHKDYNECMSDTPCLKLSSKDKERTIEALRDFEAGVLNQSNPWEIRCCRGLSIDLLNKLSIDLDFDFTLFLVFDKSYGAYSNGSWNGMIEDLLESTAHIAMAAFSITKSRVKAIDFTDPYFFSGFSILVADRVRDPHMQAFLEPFSIGVWFAIFISATVTAVAMALFEWNSPFGLNPWGRKRKSNYTMASGLNMVYSVLFGHTVSTKSPKAWPSKVMQNFWAFAAIFIIASYTANLAAFIAGKNNGVGYNGIYDSRLLDARVGVLGGSAVEAFINRIHRPIFHASQNYLVNSSDTGIRMLIDGKLDAYLGDYPILDYARAKLDPNCQLKLVGQTYGEDGYGIGLPKNSTIRIPLSEKILDYHQSGFIEDLIEVHFADAQCYQQRMTQEESQLEVQHHAGLFVLLTVGILLGIIVLLLEHAAFKVLVPYFRATPGNSCWRSSHVMFLSQRLHRIITSAELVSPQDSAKEMISIVKNKEFTRLFQKSTIRKNKLADMAKTKRLNRNFCDVVAKAKWMQDLKDNNLIDDSSTAAPEIIEIPLRDLCTNIDLEALRKQNEPVDGDDDWPITWQEDWLLSDHDETVPLNADNSSSQPQICQSDCTLLLESPAKRGPNTPSKTSLVDSETFSMGEVNSAIVSDECNIDLNLDVEEDQQSDRTLVCPRQSSPRVRFADNIINGRLSCSDLSCMPGEVPNNVYDSKYCKRKSSWCEDRNNILASVGSKNTRVLPMKNNKFKSLIWKRPSLQDQLLPSMQAGFCVENITKEELLVMWKTSEIELTKRLEKALKEKAKLEEKLADLEFGSLV